MATKVAEHLVILNDHAQGLLNRSYNLLHFDPPKFPDVELEKFIKKMGENFPKFPEKLLKEKGMEIFTRRATEISTAFYDYYYTYVDIVRFNDKAFAELQSLSENLFAIDMEICPDITRYFMNLFCNWAKLHILTSRSFESAKPILAAYARAHHTVSGNSEVKFNDIASYMSDFIKPVEKIRSILEPTSIPSFLGMILVKLSVPLSGYRDRVNLINRGVFSVLDKSDDMLAHKNETMHFHMSHLWEMRDWTTWGYLLCPSELCVDGAVDIMCLALSELVALHVHRDECFDVHEEVERLFSDFQVKKIKFKLSKYKQAVKDIYSNYDPLLSRRQEFRRLMAVELQSLHAFIRISPSGVMLGPKMSLVTSLLRAASDEVFWYMYNSAWVAAGHRPYKASSKFSIPQDPLVAELVHLIVLVTAVLRSHAPGVLDIPVDRDAPGAQPNADGIPVKPVPSPAVAYYNEWLRTDLPHIQGAYDAVAAAFPLPASVKKVMDEIAETLTRIGPASGANSGVAGAAVVQGIDSGVVAYDQYRLNCYRLLCALRHRQVGVLEHSPPVITLMKMLNTSVTHSRYIDSIDTICDDACGLARLHWFHTQVDAEMSALLQHAHRTSLYAVSWLSVYPAALINVHPLCPEEAKPIAVKAAQAADNLLVRISSVTMKWFSTMVKYNLALRSGVAPSQALKRMGAAAADPPPLPGAESQLGGEAMVQMHGLKLQYACVQSLVAALAQTPCLNIYTFVLSPREYAISALQDHFRMLVRAQVVPSVLNSDGSINAAVDQMLNTVDIDATISSNTAAVMAASAPTPAGPAPLNPTHYHNSNSNNSKAAIKRPSLIETSVACILATFLQVDRQANLGIAEMCSAILQTEFCGIYPRAGGESAGHVTFTETGKGDDGIVLRQPILYYIVNYYVNIFSQDLEQMLVLHSSILHSFEARKVVDHRGHTTSSYVPVQLYLSEAELVALARLIGNRGIDYLCKQLLTVVHKYVEHIFGIVSENSTVLTGLRARYTEPQVWVAQAQQCTRRDEFLSACTNVGNVLQFREMLYGALRIITAERCPVAAKTLADSVRAAKSVVPDHLFDSRVGGLRGVATLATGHLTPCHDPALRDCVRRFKTSVQDQQVWQLLPELLCVALLSPTSPLARAQYLVNTEGYSNNAHLVAVTVRDLVAATTALPYQHKQIVSDADDKIKEALTRVVSVSAYAIVNLHAAQHKVASASLMVMLEQYVQVCRGWLCMSVLDTCVPYTLLRTQYAKMHEEQISQFTAVDEDKE